MNPPAPPGRLPAWLPWVLPFTLFMVLLGVMPRLGLGPVTDQLIRIGLIGGVLLTISRPVIDLSVGHPLGSIVLGVAVFIVWIGPDWLIPGWHDGPLFSNGIVGRPESSFPEAGRGDTLSLSLRTFRAAIIVPIVEELFWRGWLPRWAIDTRFERVPLGRFTAWTFGITAVLFASEHGSFWDVGLVAGIAYNWWMIRTRRLGDCILAHAVTNACLSAYVIATGQWQFW